MRGILFAVAFLAVGLTWQAKAWADNNPQPPAYQYNLYDYWRLTEPGDSCQFSPDCDRGENCMEDQQCSPAQCDDTHKCVIGENCDTGFCHV